MKIERTEEGLLLAKLDSFLVDLLREIPVQANPGESPAARDRLYSKPGDDLHAIEEWREYVEPELRTIFETANQTVVRDLGRFDEVSPVKAKAPSLLIPRAHFENWLSSLNQARLVLAARHAFTDEDLTRDEPPSFATERDFHLFQIHFYGFLQECLLREMERL